MRRIAERPAGQDYSGHYRTALTFTAGQRSRTITVQTAEDTLDESDETFYVYLTDAESKLTNYIPTDYLARATGTIRDAGSAPTPSITDASAEEGDSLTFTVTLDRTPSSSATYYYATYQGTATGGNVDYFGEYASALRFSAGQTSRTITVRTVEDTEDEEDETFYVYLTDASSKHPSSGVPVDYLARATGTIRDDDSALTPSITDASADEGDSITFTVTLDRTPASSVTLYYATYRGTAGSGDYTGHYATALTFGVGQRSRTITVQTTEDTEDESDETFYVYLTDAANKHPYSGVPSDYLARATGTIRDDDAGATPSISDASADEGDSLTFAVRLDRAPTSSVTYYYATYRGTAGSADYTGHYATALTFSTGQTYRTITVHTTEDTEDEDDETLYVYLTDAANKHPYSGVPSDYLARATGTILDDDTASVPTPRISDASAEEGDPIVFTVTLDRAPASAVTFYYATYRGSAGSEDYTGHYATALTFSAGQTWAHHHGVHDRGHGGRERRRVLRLPHRRGEQASDRRNTVGLPCQRDRHHPRRRHGFDTDAEHFQCKRRGRRFDHLHGDARPHAVKQRNLLLRDVSSHGRERGLTLVTTRPR